MTSAFLVPFMMYRRSQKFHNKYKRYLQRRSLSILPTYTWSFLLGLVQLTLLQNRNVSSYFFFSYFWGQPQFVLKGIFIWFFSTNFLMTSAFLCGLFGKWLSARNRLRWSICSLLNELCELGEHWPASSTSTAFFFLFCCLRYHSFTHSL